MAIKIELDNGKIKLLLNKSQGGIRIADEHGNHVSSPTKTLNRPKYSIEWMITNDENQALVKEFFESEDDIKKLVQGMGKIKRFTEESEYSKRETIKVEREEIETFEGFKIYQYTENFFSFEKELASGIKVRITFKLGDFGLEPHPHMYVLIPFNNQFLKLKNLNDEVKETKELGKGCFGEWTPSVQDIEEIIITLAHASKNHKDDLINIIQSIIKS